MEFRYFMPVDVRFGPGKLKELHTMPLPGKRALILMTKGGSARRHGYLQTVEEQLDLAGVSYVECGIVNPNPTRDNVNEAARICKEEKCDFAIALGGGSVIDCAKAVGVTVANGGDYWDYVKWGTGGKKPIEKTDFPFIVITTTSGTGSEVDTGCVITNTATDEKIGSGDPRNFAKLAVVDPELTLSVPPRFTAFQGFDVLFHVSECYISKAENWIIDMFAPEVMARVARSLPVCVANGADLEARSDMAWANIEAGFCLQHGSLTCQHSMEHALSGIYQDLTHGAGLILLSRAYFTYCYRNLELRPRLAVMAEKLGHPEPEKDLAFVEALENLKEACGVSDVTMKNFGITPDSFEKTVAFCHNHKGVGMERRPMSDEDIMAVLNQAYAY